MGYTDTNGGGDYAKTTVDPTLYGSSTTSAGGTKYNPTDFEKSLVNTSQGGITKSLNQLINPTYDSADFNKYKSNLRQQQANGFENTVVNPLVKRGLLGTTGANNLANQYGSTMAQQDSDLMDKYKNENSSILNQLLGVYSIPYDMMNKTGGMSQSLSNNVSNYNLANTQLKMQQQAANDAKTNQYVQAAATGAMMLSDRNAKKNIKKIGEKNGINIYEFEYKPEYNQPKGKHIGVIAQEVEHIPSAVINIDGIKHVDYSIINKLIA